MVRIRERLDSEEPAAHSTDGMENDAGKSTLLGRRSVLKLAGAGVTALATGVGTASAASYETITVPAGSEKTIRLSDGETFENKLIDVTADYTRVSIKATGENWTIRNIGIKGVHDQDGGHAVLALKAANGSDCLVENVWMGDGSATYDGAGSSETAVWVSPESTGTITIRNSNFQGWKDNAIYASAPGREGDGPVIIENCYAKNNNHADYRIGSHGSVVRDSVVVHDSDGSDSRGIWCWYNDQLTVENCDVEMNGYGASIHAGPYEPGFVDVYGTQYEGRLVENGRGDGEINLISGNGTNPSISIPDGVPTTAEEAASGEVSSGSGTTSDGSDGSTTEPLSNSLRIETDPGADLVTYEVQTSGEIQLGDASESPDEAVQNTDGTWTASGIVGDGAADSWSFEGEILGVTYDNPMTLIVNGSEVDPAVFDMNRLRLETQSGDPLANYEFTTSGQIKLGAESEDPDTATQNDDGTWTATGTVGDGGADSWYFDGTLKDVAADNPVTVLVNGEEVDERVLGKDLVRIETDAGADLVEYTLTTAEEIVLGPASENPDEVSQNADGTWSATGLVGDGAADSYYFGGELLDFEYDNPVTLVVNGQVVDPESLSSSTLRIGTESGADLVEYAVTTSGQIELGDEAESPDAVTENDDGTWTATGVVGNGWADTYQFQGELVDFDYDNPVTLAVDGESIDPKTVGPANTLRIQSDANNVRYRFATSGRIELGEKAENPDSASQNKDGSWSAKGVVGAGYSDTWTFRGYLKSFDVKKDATVTVNGEPVDLSVL